MNFRPSFYLIAGCLLLSLTLKAQNNLFNNHGLPLKSLESPAFGNDIVMHDHPERNQRNVTVCSAFNGWLYAAYNYTVGLQGAISILKSTDGGLTWTVLIEGPSGTDYVSYSKIDIIATGTDPSNIKLVLASCTYDSQTHKHSAQVVKIDGNTGEVSEDLLQEGLSQIKDIAIASDYPFISAGSTMGSFAVIYSKEYTNDEIIFRSCSNGGDFFDYTTTVAVTLAYFDKVDLSYGHCSAYPEGRYFGSWEEKQNESSPMGHIYTSHSENGINSLFTSAVCIDSLDPNTINLMRCPKISTQNSDDNNDSLNLSEIILCESYNQQSHEYDTKGFYTEKALSTGGFGTFTIPSKRQPDIDFNYYDSTFMMTYYDSINKKLPYLTTHMNFNEPLTWNVLSSGYNDESNLEDPRPKVRLDYATMTGMNVWTKGEGGDNGVVLFDAPFHYYTSIEPPKNINIDLVKVYPNPSDGIVNFEYPVSEKEIIKIDIISASGQKLISRQFRYDHNGFSRETLDLSKLASGVYIYRIEKVHGILQGKLIIDQIIYK